VNEARLQRERYNVDDVASFLVELGRLAAVDEWEQGRVVEIRAEGKRRRHEHRQAGAGAVARMLDRGETLTAIAELASVKVSEVRAVLPQVWVRLAVVTSRCSRIPSSDDGFVAVCLPAVMNALSVNRWQHGFC
jgi:hypothetical protein